MGTSIFIGTSGWKYKHWNEVFYPKELPQKHQLGYYHQHFKTVELNNSFYRKPSLAQFIGWKNAVPANFIFVVKANRFFTHLKKLNVAQADILNFLSNCDGLTEKLGPILFQLPPKWKINTDRLAYFLALLPSGYRFCFEFRNETWYQPEVYALLKKYNIAFCIYHLAGHQSPLEITADFTYIRLHGPRGKYQGSYTEDELKNWAKFCRNKAQQGKDVYIYFDNDEAGYAAFNAQRLKELLAVDGERH